MLLASLFQVVSCNEIQKRVRSRPKTLLMVQKKGTAIRAPSMVSRDAVRRVGPLRLTQQSVAPRHAHVRVRGPPDEPGNLCGWWGAQVSSAQGRRFFPPRLTRPCAFAFGLSTMALPEPRLAMEPMSLCLKIVSPCSSIPSSSPICPLRTRARCFPFCDATWAVEGRTLPLICAQSPIA